MAMSYIHFDEYDYGLVKEGSLTKADLRRISEEAGLHIYNFPMPSITVDIVYMVHSWDREDKCTKKEILLIKRGGAVYNGYWAFPGGFMEMGETLHAAAVRELREETGIEEFALDFQFVSDTIDRDPRQRVLSAVFLKVVNEYPDVKGMDDAVDAQWFSLNDLLLGKIELAFDHQDILNRLWKEGKL